MKKLICPECKNDVNFSGKQEPSKGEIVECNHCGITLEITKIEGDILEAQVADEGK